MNESTDDSDEVKEWTFYRKTPKRTLGGVTYERDKEWTFTGTKEEAQAKLRDRIDRTWSPFVQYGYSLSYEPDE